MVAALAAEDISIVWRSTDTVMIVANGIDCCKWERYFLQDGDVDDGAATTDAIVAASDLPISIITIGLTAPVHY
jgi:hypothetical protein